MLTHKFANYVVQTLMIHNSELEKAQELAKLIKKLAKSLKNDEIASKAIIKLSKTFDIGPVHQNRRNNNGGYNGRGGNGNQRGGGKRRRGGGFNGGYKKKHIYTKRNGSDDN